MMAWFSLVIATLTLLFLSTNPTFSISKLSHDPPFPPEDALQLILQPSSSFSIILFSDPFIFNSSTSFSSVFTFEIDRVALVIFPANFPSKFARNMSFELLDANQFLGIEFHANVCKLSSSKVGNISKNSNALKDGVILSSWVDYSAISKRLNVSLSKLGDPKPFEPLISHRIDLVKVLKGEEVLLGLASSNENVYAWRSEFKDFHEESVVFFGFDKRKHSVPSLLQEHSKSEKKGGFLSYSGFIFATGCGVLAALVMFFVGSCAVDRLKVHTEASVHPVDCKFERIDVLEVKNSELL